jgi:hypothetical protein
MRTYDLIAVLVQKKQKTMPDVTICSRGPLDRPRRPTACAHIPMRSGTRMGPLTLGRIGSKSDWDFFFNTFVADDVREKTLESLADAKQSVCAALVTGPTDQTVLKNRYSALIPGSSPLERMLRGMEIDTILVAGTKTNVCCESTARDTMMLDFKVVLVEDCSAALSDDEHRSALGKHHPAIR